MLWAIHGATSYAAWLSWRIGLAPHAAREKIRVARALARLPRIDRAFSEGRLSFSKVRALTRVAEASNEANLLDMALHAPAAELERICRGVRRVVRNEEGEVITPEPAERWARQRVMDDGSVRIEAQLLPDEAARVWKAIELARRLGDDEMLDGATLDGASALVRIADAFLAHPREERAQPVTEIAIVLERDRLQDDPAALTARLEDGAHVPAETLRRVACDCAVRAVISDEHGSPLDVGRRTRVIPARLRRHECSLAEVAHRSERCARGGERPERASRFSTVRRRALTLRDRHCRFPGCTHRAWLDAHHVEHWLHGGSTDLANLVLLCQTHHRLVHEGGFALELEGGETVARQTVVRAPVDGTCRARSRSRGPRFRSSTRCASPRRRRSPTSRSCRGGTGGRSIWTRASRRACPGGRRP